VYHPLSPKEILNLYSIKIILCHKFLLQFCRLKIWIKNKIKNELEKKYDGFYHVTITNMDQSNKNTMNHLSYHVKF
jgi:hypothetical protein